MTYEADGRSPYIFLMTIVGSEIVNNQVLIDLILKVLSRASDHKTIFLLRSNLKGLLDRRRSNILLDEVWRGQLDLPDDVVQAKLTRTT